MRLSLILVALLLLQTVHGIVVIEGPSWGTRAEYGPDVTNKKWNVDLEEGPANFLIRQKNGHYSSLDFVTVKADKRTVYPMSAKQDGKSIIEKVGGWDNNIIDIHENPVEVKFYLPKAKKYELQISANEYQDSKLPLRSPKYGFATARVFKGTMEIDGVLDEELGPINNPIWWVLINGRPQGYTYSWFRSDGEYLYVAIEVTGDSTNVGNEHISLIVEVPRAGFEKYTIAKDENEYGKSGFQYTELVPWEHKVFEFKIPIKEKVKRVRYALEYY